MSRKALLYTLLLLVIPVALTYGQKSSPPFEVTVHGTYGDYGMKELNNLTIVNWKTLGYKRFPILEGGLGFGAGARVILAENFSIGLSYTRLTGSTAFAKDDIYEKTAVAEHKKTGDFSYDVSANVYEFIPMYNLSPSLFMNVYLGLALGYYMGAGEGEEVATDSIKTTGSVDYSTSSGYPINRKGPIEGTGMGVRGFFEFDVPINEQIFAYGELGWRFATTEEVNFVSALEYSGYYFAIGAGYHFKFGKQKAQRAE